MSSLQWRTPRSVRDAVVSAHLLQELPRGMSWFICLLISYLFSYLILFHIKQLIKTNQHNCPSCNRHLTPEMFRSTKLKRNPCHYQPYGCVFFGTAEALRSHLGQCQFQYPFLNAIRNPVQVQVQVQAPSPPKSSRPIATVSPSRPTGLVESRLTGSESRESVPEVLSFFDRRAYAPIKINPINLLLILVTTLFFFIILIVVIVLLCSSRPN